MFKNRQCIRFWRMTLKDFIYNQYYKIRFKYYRYFKKNKLQDYSPENKDDKNLTLTFCDNFDKKSWTGKSKKWNVGEQWGNFHPERPNAYFGPPKEIINNKAVFSVEYKPKTFYLNNKEYNIPFKISWLNTSRTFKQQYGRFECRMTLPREKGTWPAFWLWGPTWPPEIDILEGYGGHNGKSITRQEINVHWNTKQKRKHIRPWCLRVDNYKNVGENFYEFALEWTPNGMFFFTNGVLIYQMTNKKILNQWFNKEGITPWLVLNHNIRNDGSNGDSKWINKEEESSYYSEFLVDYVRAYINGKHYGNNN